MKIYYTDQFQVPLPAGHRFPISKYTLLKKRVMQMAEGPQAGRIELQAAGAATEAQLCLAHTPEYIHKVFEGRLSEKELRRTGFPWSPGLVQRSQHSVGATIEACRDALEAGLSANLGGGTHHAYPEHGEGYCVFNDVAVAVRLLQKEGRIRRALLVDCDAHQGNGNAAIFAGDQSVFTFDLYGAKNFPFHKENPSLGVPLADGTGDHEYLETLEEGLWRAVCLAHPDLVVYLAGADPFQGDRLGRLSLSKAGLAERDYLVLNTLKSQGFPVAVVMAGGYGYHIEETAEIQATTIEIALTI